MQYKLGIWSCLGLGFFSTFSWAGDPTATLETIRIQANSTLESDTQSTASTKFSHDVLDVPLIEPLFRNNNLNNKMFNE
jgi:iron complex outermembrane receptor protein